MPKRRSKQPIQSAKTIDVAARLRRALAKRAKDELVDFLVEVAADDRAILRRLEARFELDAPAEEIVVATRQAIADATDFDERDINRNFDYDWEAYSAVTRNLSQLIDRGHLQAVMELSLDLMRKG